MRIIGYTYDADMHCPACTVRDAGLGILTRQMPHRATLSDEHGLGYDLIDAEGNPVHPIFSTDDNSHLEYCGDCREKLL